eukprot:CAMPEP_0184689292 /NCGR_PEP_ID=MMETSP0312-20130426/30571_1 /TAXON_ID=31354 /ORGANISM="Compsopogon coeruleus, Strain SAG 36.94" /LENGTH=424 /DNA_ID=CAMNT_0027146623 /DNA_START=1609 /DNA_END=2883 /DNA_ORIENTATION=-
MVVCQYFLRGRCKFGNHCRDEHPPRPNVSGGGSGGWSRPAVPVKVAADPFRTGGGGGGRGGRGGGGRGNGRGGGGSASWTQNASQSGIVPKDPFWQQRGGGASSGNWRGPAGNIDGKLNREDLTSGFPQWPLTCYGRDEEDNLLVGDVSMEEARVRAYHALRSGAGSFQEIVTEEARTAATHRERIALLLDPRKGDIFSNPMGPVSSQVPSSSPLFAQPLASTSTSMLGTPATPSFFLPSSSPSFGHPLATTPSPMTVAQSPFGGPFSTQPNRSASFGFSGQILASQQSSPGFDPQGLFQPAPASNPSVASQHSLPFTPFPQNNETFLNAANTSTWSSNMGADVQSGHGSAPPSSAFDFSTGSTRPSSVILATESFSNTQGVRSTLNTQANQPKDIPEEAMSAFTAERFVYGSVPEFPPPMELC